MILFIYLKNFLNYFLEIEKSQIKKLFNKIYKFSYLK
jgi:hypothetical protein